MGWAAGANASRAASADSPTTHWPNERTRPEDVFLAWLAWLPADADLAGAARAEIARLDSAAPLGPGPQRLRALMVQLMAAA